MLLSLHTKATHAIFHATSLMSGEWNLLQAGVRQQAVKAQDESAARPPPRPCGLRPAGPLALLLAPYIPPRACSWLAPRQRAWGPAAKCKHYSLTGPKYDQGFGGRPARRSPPGSPVCISVFRKPRKCIPGKACREDPSVRIHNLFPRGAKL